VKREQLDPYWHRSRVAARIILKARSGRALNARDKRLARAFSEDRFVSNRLVQQGLYYLSPELRTEMYERVQKIARGELAPTPLKHAVGQFD